MEKPTWYEWSTGGGCTALRLNVGAHHYVLATQCDGSEVPSDEYAPVDVGIYRDDPTGSFMVGFCEFAYWGDARRDVQRTAAHGVGEVLRLVCGEDPSQTYARSAIADELCAEWTARHTSPWEIAGDVVSATGVPVDPESEDMLSTLTVGQMYAVLARVRRYSADDNGIPD